MTSISFTSGELLDIMSALEIKENQTKDPNLAAYYMHIGVQFQRVYERLQERPGEKRVANLVLAD